MAVCACGTGLFQLFPKVAAVSSSVSSQLRPERGAQIRDVQCVSGSPSFKCVCNVGYGGNKGALVHSSSLKNSGKPSSSRRSRGRDCESRKGYKNCGGLDRKPAVEVQARVQDTVEHESYGRETCLENRFRGKDRNWRQYYGSERRRRVQVVTNNNLVDLEEQLGITKGSEEGNLRLRLSSRQNENQVQRDEEGRLYFEYEFNGADINESPELESSSFYSAEEVQSRQEGDAPTLAQATSVLDIGTFLTSERVTEMGQSPTEVPALPVEFDLEAQSPDEQSTGGSDQEVDTWIEVGSQPSKSLLDSPGGQRVAELVGAWDGLAGRLPPDFGTSSSSPLLLAALKLTVSTLQHTSPAEDGRNPLSRALSVAYILADLGMDAEVIASGLLREVVETEYLKVAAVEEVLGKGVGRLLHDCSRVKHMPSHLDTLDDASAKAVRQFCLAFHDVRAVVVEVAARLDTMRHIQTLPRYRQQIMALETMQIYAPLAHAMGTGTMSLELEDLAFWVLFPDSYAYIGSWLKRHWADGDDVVRECRDCLQAALEEDLELRTLVEAVEITGRCKSRYSTMKKLLRDGRLPEEVFDVLGLRVVLTPRTGVSVSEKERGAQACYRAMEIATSLWKEVPGRLKDYIAKPKKNGYESLHLAVSLGNRGNWSPPMELQIRTAAMDAMAEGGLASHSLYKGGLTDPEQAGYLKAIMQAAADVATTRYPDLASNTVEVIEGKDTQTENDYMFTLFDKNKDGVISMDEFKEVIGELGADGEDAHELMKLVDSNFDGSVSVEEFQDFRRQVKIFENLAGVDRQFTSQLDQKLLSGAAYSEGGVSSSMPGNASMTALDSPSPLPTDGQNSKLERSTLERLLETSSAGKSSNGSTMTSAIAQEVDYPMKDFEQQMWMDRVKNSEKGSTSSSSGSSNSSRSGIRSLAKLGKPSKPGRASANRKGLSVIDDNVDVTIFQRDSWQSSAVGEVEKEDTLQLAHEEAESVELVIEEELANVRRQIASCDVMSARRTLQKLLKKYPHNPNVMVHFAQLERKGGDAVAAGAYYERAIAAFKEQEVYGLNYVRALQAWGSLEAQARNSNRARYLFLESLRIAQKGEKAGLKELLGAGVYGLHGWAMLEQRLGNWSKARDLLERAAKIQPGNAVVHQSRALLEARAHNYAAARYHFRLAVESAPGDVKCWQAWALFEATQGKPGKMRQLFRKALEVEPNNIHSLQAWAHQESLLGSESSRSCARKLYQRCVEVNPESVYSWQAWAILEQDAGNLTGARILFERGLGASPHNIPCLQAYAHMERVDGNVEAAKKLLLIALSLEPGNPATLMEIALIEEAIGNKEAAAEYFQMAGIADKQKSRVKRKMFESRKAAPKFKPSKSKDLAPSKASLQPAKARAPNRQGNAKPRDIWSSKQIPS